MKIAFSLVFVFGYLSYAFPSLDTYINGASVFLILLFVILKGFSRPKFNLGTILIVAYGILVFASAFLGAETMSGLIVSTTYAIIPLLLYLSKVELTDVFSNYTIRTVWVIFLIQILTFFLNLIGLLPLEIVRGGFFGLPGAATLIENPNYAYITTLLCAIILIAGTGNKKILVIAVACILIVMLMFLGSRGGVLVTVLSILLLIIKPKYLLPTIIVSALLSFALMFGESSLDALLDSNPEGIRLEKGFNERDIIWLIAASIIDSHQYFGIGDIPRMENLMLDMGSPSAAIQNTYILTAIRNGLPAAITLILMLFIAFHYYGYSINKNRHLFACLSVIAVDSFFRSYSLGGVGFVSILFTVLIVMSLKGSLIRNLAQQTRPVSH